MKSLAVLLIAICCSSGVYSCCRSGWASYGGSCYGLSNELLTWPEAQAVCAGFGGHLAVIETRSEGEYLENLAQSKGGDRSWWIGATDMMNEGALTWITSGQQVESSSNWSHSYQPDNYGGVENCLEIRGLFGYKWNDWTCTKRANFICETVEIV